MPYEQLYAISPTRAPICPVLKRPRPEFWAVNAARHKQRAQQVPAVQRANRHRTGELVDIRDVGGDAAA
jgi:hypothetical protein